MTGTMTGEMEMPDGTKAPPTNRFATVDMCMITEWNGGKMSKGTMYGYDDISSRNRGHTFLTPHTSTGAIN